MIGEFVGGMLTEIAAGIVQGLADEGISKIKDALSPTYKNPTVPPKAVKAKHAKPEKKPYVSRDKRHERNLKKKLNLQKRRAITNSEGA